MKEQKKARVQAQLQDAYDGVVKAIENGEISEQRPLRQLQFIEIELKKMITALEIGQLPPRETRAPGLWHLVVDTWSPQDVLGDKIVASEIAYERL